MLKMLPMLSAYYKTLISKSEGRCLSALAPAELDGRAIYYGGDEVIDCITERDLAEVEQARLVYELGRRPSISKAPYYYMVENAILLGSGALVLENETVIPELLPQSPVVGKDVNLYAPVVHCVKELLSCKFFGQPSSLYGDSVTCIVDTVYSANYYHLLLDGVLQFFDVCKAVEISGVSRVVLILRNKASLEIFRRLAARLLRGVEYEFVFMSELPSPVGIANLMVVSPYRAGFSFSRRRTRESVRVMRDVFQCETGRCFNSSLYITRGRAKKRRVRNESEVIEILRRHIDVDVVELEDCSFEEQVRMFSGARFVVGAHGAGLANLVYADTATVIELIPCGPRYDCSHYEKMSQVLGLDYKRFNANAIDTLGCFYVNQDEFGEFLRRVLKEGSDA